MLTTKPLKSQKNSFIFLETVFSILILSFLVTSFFKLTHNKEEKLQQLNAIDNQFKEKNYDQNFLITNENITFIKNDNETFTLNLKKITYENSKVKLIQYAK